MNDKSKLVQVKMLDNTLNELDDLQQRTHALSRSDAVRKSIEIVSALAKSVEKGDKIIIESKNGTQKQIIITGMKAA